MKRIKAVTLAALLLYGTQIFSPVVTFAQPVTPLKWVSVDVVEQTEEPVKPPEVIQLSSKSKKNQDNSSKQLSPVSTEDPDYLAKTIEEINKRRQADDLLLAQLMSKQKEQEDQRKAEDNKKLLAELTAMQEKQKAEEQDKLTRVIEEMKKQQLEQQAEQNKTIMQLIEALKPPVRQNPYPAVNITPIGDEGTAEIKKTIQEHIADNTQDAAAAPTREADITFFYSPGALYRIYCKENFVTDIQLQPGEEIQYVGGGDTVRWVIERAQSGSGADRRWHLYIMPMQSNLSTNIVVTTNKHSYQVMVKTANWYTPIVKWAYPHEERAAQMQQQVKQKELDDNSIDFGPVTPEQMNFNYRVKGNYEWTPETVFDVKGKTYIKMPAGMAESSAPVLFIKDENKKLIMVNYRIKNGTFVVDRLFKEAELRSGKDVVRIRRN